MSENNLKKYYLIYKDPFVIYLRERLNTLAKEPKNKDNQTTTENNGLIDGLPLFWNDAGYNKSKFIVLAVNDNHFGGSTIDILFQDKPDRIFSAWVYKIVGGEYELRGFWTTEKDKMTPEQIDYYKPVLLEKNHAI